MKKNPNLLSNYYIIDFISPNKINTKRFFFQFSFTNFCSFLMVLLSNDKVVDWIFIIETDDFLSSFNDRILEFS
jgi:hypothetical protein